MADKNTGLKFNPYATFNANTAGLSAFTQQKQTTSAPTKTNSVVSDYYTAPTPTSTPGTIWDYKPSTQWLQQSNALVNQLVNTPIEQLDPMYNINQWDLGLEGLSKGERALWEKENAAYTQGLSDLEKDRMWRNQQFVNAFDIDTFNSYDKDKRDALMENKLTYEAVQKKFYNNDNLEQLLSLTPEGKRELLKSDYKNVEGLKDSDSIVDKKGFWDYSLGERWNAIDNDVTSMGTKYSIAGSMIGTVLASAPTAGLASWLGAVTGGAIGGAAGVLAGLAEGIVHPEDAKEIDKASIRTENEDILNKITTSDNERKKEQSKDEISSLTNMYLDAYNKGQITKEQVDKLFDDMALNGTRTAIDELGNPEEYNYSGSNYYSAFKDTDEFEHFTTTDKLRALAQAEILGRKYGKGDALQILDQDMANEVNKGQTGWTWAGNTLKNLWVGGLANLGQKITGLEAFTAANYYGIKGAIEEGDLENFTDNYKKYGDAALANYLEGKDASGDGSKNANVFNPKYWDKVDQYNTLGIDESDGWIGKLIGDKEDEMDRAERNGGISTSTNVYKPGSENIFWSWSTLNNAVAMNKFAWSDLLTNMGLAKIVSKATALTGGIQGTAPGVLATESSKLSKFINTAGSLGVINSSSLGIDMAYGMQTYQDVLDKNNAKLDKIIQQDVDTEIGKRLQTKEAQAEIQNYITEVNKRRKAQAGEKGNWIPISREQAIQDYSQHLEKQIRAEQEELHKEDREAARREAADAFAVDATIEHLRMAGTAGMFKSYLFDKGTLNALRLNNPYVNTTFKNGAYALGKHATAKKAAQILGQNVWGGFHSNYFDDITVGLAEGFGLQSYNNYLLSKYNPAAYGSVMDDYVNPWIAGMTGAKEAAGQKRSFLDGAVGAIGSVFTFTPNIQGMRNHSERMKQAAEQAEKDSKAGIKTSSISNIEKISDFLANPVLQAVADARNATRMTEREINRVNKTIKDNAYALDNIVESANALNMKALTREGTSVMEAEDAKDREAFTLASQLLSLQNSSVVANAQVEPDKANWSRKKKAAKAIGSALDFMLGTNMFTEYSESPSTRAMQTLQDASTIEEASSEEELARKKELIDTFLGLDANKNALNGKSEEDKEAFAIERLQKNAKGLLGMMKSMQKIQEKFENSVTATQSPDIKMQLMYQYVLDKRWKDRLRGIEEDITGEEFNEDDVDTWYNNYMKSHDTENSTIAQYGSSKGITTAIKQQEKKVSEAQNSVNKAESELKKGADPTKSIAENSRINAMRRFLLDTAKSNLKKEESKLSELQKSKDAFFTTSEDGSSIEKEISVIKAEDILKLSPNDRLRMLDDYYRENYSTEQQAEIDRAKNILMQDGTSLNTVMENLRDAAILSNRISDNMEVAKKIMSNPAIAVQLQDAAIENRRNKVIDYFNDKVVLEAFQFMVNDPASTVSADAVAEKVREQSTSVLYGMRKMLEKEMSNKDSKHSNKTLDTIIDGINKVLDERTNRVKDTIGLDNYLKKTKKVSHTEEVSISVPNEEGSEEGTAIPQKVTSEYELSQNDRKLLEYALDYAVERGISIDNLAEAVKTVDFDKYVDDRNHSYETAVNPMTGNPMPVNVATVENQANKVSPEYMSTLVGDMVDSYKSHKEAVAEATKEKKTTGASSVATKTVEPKSKEVKDDSRPDDVLASDDPLGINKPKTIESEKPSTPAEDKTFKEGDELTLTSYDAEGNEIADQSGSVKVVKVFDNGGIKVEALDGASKGQQWEISPNKVKQFFGESKPFTQGAHTNITHNNRLGNATPYKETSNPSEENTGSNNRNQQILEDALTFNEKLIKDIGTLLDKIDKMSMSDNIREKLKDIIQAHISNKSFDNIKALQGAILQDALLMDAEVPGISTKATIVAGIDIAEAKKEAASNTSTDSTEESPLVVKPMPMELSTMDLDFFIDNPNFLPQSDYIKQHGIIGFLQRLADAWNSDRDTHKKTGADVPIHKSQVVFLYDEVLAAKVAENMQKAGMEYHPELDSPIVMAMEITDINKHLVEDESQLIEITDVPDGMSHKYMPLGFMPANTNQRESNTARRMSAIRESVDYAKNEGKKTKEPQIIRYASSTGKVGKGGAIKTSIKGGGIETHTEEDKIPHSTEDTPKKDVQQLMDENSQSATESFVSATDEEKEAYKKAVESGNKESVRQTSLYKKLRDAFIKRLVKAKKEGETEEDKDQTSLVFNLQKGTNSTYPKIVLIKKIGDTIARNSTRKIVEILREFDDSIEAAQEIINSNSRFSRLFSKLQKVSVDKEALRKITDRVGNITNETEYKKILFEYGELVKSAIDNNLNVDQIAVDITLSEDKQNINVAVYSGDKIAENILSTLTTRLEGTVSEAEFASFIRDLILDKDGNTRQNLRGFEKVKWQVNYKDAETANSTAVDNAEKVNKKNATDNLKALYDDGVLEMQATKLAYPARRVTVEINQKMKALYAVPEKATTLPTETAPVGTVESKEGKLDSDTGAITTPTRESIVKAIPANILGAIQKIIADSQNRKLTDDGKHYSILGQLWSRVTSIKSSLPGLSGRFNPRNAWGLPSTSIGNSLDEFGRDVFNGIFEGKSEAELLEMFENYDNSTAKNYAEVYQKLKEFELRLLAKNQVIIGTLNKDTGEAGQITTKGLLNVQVKTADGIVTKQVRVAGTLDVLAIDKDGNLHIYDFKTAHSKLDATKAVEKGYDRQLSMYAKFLEDELSAFGIKVKSINLIPVDVSYPTPSGEDNNGNAIQGAQAEYKTSRPGSSQLLTKPIGADDSTFIEFKRANFQVQQEILLTRLEGEALTASFDKMTEEEKAAIVEAVKEQEEAKPGETAPKAADVVGTQPIVGKNKTDNFEERKERKRWAPPSNHSQNKPTITDEKAADAINGENSPLKKIDDLINACKK